jgi:hypothetical protein
VRGLEQTSNIIDAFEQNYNKGFRLFEINLIKDKDDQIILSTNENLESANNQIVDFEKFLYTLKQYPDAYVILNIKNDFRDIIEKITKQNQPYQEIYNQLIPLIYDISDIEFLYNRYAFNDLIYSSYGKANLSIDELFEIAKTSGATAIITPYDKKLLSLKEKLAKINVSYVVDSIEKANESDALQKNGIGVFIN